MDIASSFVVSSLYCLIPIMIVIITKVALLVEGGNISVSWFFLFQFYSSKLFLLVLSCEWNSLNCIQLDKCSIPILLWSYLFRIKRSALRRTSIHTNTFCIICIFLIFGLWFNSSYSVCFN